MKRIFVVSLVALGLLTTSVAHAAEGDITIGPLVGVTVPYDSLGDQAGSGFAIGATGDYEYSPVVKFGGDIIFNPYGSENFAGGEFSISVLHITGHGKYYFSPDGEYPFFATGILGFYRASVEFTSDPGNEFVGSFDDSNTEFGLGLGVGVESTVMQDKTLTGQATIHIGDVDFFMLSASLLFGVGGN